MSKLKNKIFYTIFIILTTFSLTILFIFNYQDYSRTRIKIADSIHRMDTENMPKNNFPNEAKRFMDSNIYTIILNNDEIASIVSHRVDENISSEIKKEAKTIVKKANKNTNYIGNLYTEKYSYFYHDNIITLVDHVEDTRKLLVSLIVSITLFIVTELISFIIANMISRWITKPVQESFEKQRYFIADASHELKTPLAVIMASSESITETKNNKKFLENIKNESNRMNNLILKLLTLAKTENGDNKTYESIDLSKTIQKHVFSMESLLFEKNIKLDYNIDKNINYKCLSDDIKQVLSILFDNAIKHSEKDGHIIINLKNNKQRVLLEVINKGSPIKKEDEEKIFERFYRVDKSRNRGENRYGLGLTIAKNIVTNYGGEISAFSKDGYTTFKVILKK
ncbi:MAG: HAMP domain-containing histidine kinase [Bacilli bacterium]|nr:HAMP domain-containing histidine kinase [Bacilli bacterium]